MKPLNLDNRPCSPISSNCVIWQGPDIPCIKLCAGDTISDVVYKLATELCTIMDTLKITNYDLSCFNLTACPPENFQELIQFLINRICELDGTPTDTTRTTSTCPDCVVNVASCFVQGTQTTMQLVDYVRMIGEKICSIVSQITELQNQIDSLDIRVTALEDAVPPTYTLPSISTNCLQANMTGNPVSATIDLVLNALLNNPTNGYCALLDSTGSPAEISAAVLSQCITDLDQPLAALPTVTTFSAYYAGTWVQSGDLNTAADAINNLWIALCDMRTYVTNYSATINVQDTNTIDLEFSAGVLTANIQDTGWVDLNGFAWYGTYNVNNKRVPQCRRIGNAVHFRGVVMIPLQDPLNSNQPLIWDYNGSAPLTDTYFLNTTVTPSTGGPGSVVLNAGGSVTFNQGNSVIPTSIVDLGTNFDNNYTLSHKLAFRFIKIDASPLYSGTLTTLLKPIITSDKKLVLTLIKDFEESAGTGGTPSNPHSTSVANNLISHVRVGEYVPQYQNAGSVMSSSPASGVNSVELDYDATLTYPFSCDANDQTQIGGFGWVDLDGLIAYLDPCTTDIKNYSCP